jgi:hypothetical protein
MASFQQTGTVFFIDEPVQVTETFKKREFVLEVPGTYTEYIKFQTVQDKTLLLDAFNKGDTVTVHFNLRGKKYEKNGTVNFFNSLDAWKIESGEGQQPQPKQAQPKQSAPANTSARDNVMAAQKMKDDAKPKEEETFEDDGLPF